MSLSNSENYKNASLRLGTRGSPLALEQARQVQAALGRNLPHITVTIHPITTSGDRIKDRPLYDIGGKGLFVKEIEDALYNNDIDIAVHSLKDVPGHMADGLIIAATLPREDARDAFISADYKSFAELPNGSVVGTSSPRRMVQILQLNPSLNVVPLRGNVATRIKKIETGEAHATILAMAGLNRLQMTSEIKETFEIEQMLPAVCQGIIGLECRASDTTTIDILAHINCENTFKTAMCERAMLKALDGSCRTPIAGYATIFNSQITLKGMLSSLNGNAYAYESLCGNLSDYENIGLEVASKLHHRF